MKEVRKLKDTYDKYVIDEYAKDNKKLVLRLPPYHRDADDWVVITIL